MKPGLYYNLPFDQYTAIPAINKSTLDLLLHCPAALQNKREETEALFFGSACHDYVLEGKMPVVAPAVDRRTKVGKAEWEAFQQAHRGKTIVTQSEWDTIQSVHSSVHAHPTASKLLKKGRAEVTVIWKYRGHLCKARIDWLHGDIHPVDLKTTISAKPRSFSKSVQQYGYHRQAAWYLLGLNELGINATEFTFLAAEKTQPFMSNAFQLEADWIQAGMEELDELLSKYADIRKDMPLPAYTEPGIITLATPYYLKEKEQWA